MRAPHRERRSPAHPSAARAAWLFVLNAAVDAAGDPAVQPYELIGALRGLSEVNFPLAAGDARRDNLSHRDYPLLTESRYWLN